MAKDKPDTGLFSDFPPVSSKKWEQQIRKDLKDPERMKKLIWKTCEGFEVKPYYRNEDMQGLEYLNAHPGEFPYVRGNTTQKNVWTIRQDIEADNAKEANKKAVNAIDGGCNSAGFRIPDNIAPDSKYIETLLSGIDLKNTEINFIIQGYFEELLSVLKKYAGSKGVKTSDLKGSVSFDPLGYLTMNGRYPFAEEKFEKSSRELIESVKGSLQNFKIISINGQYFRDCGSSIVQELAFSLAAGNEYITGLKGKQLSVDDIAGRIKFNFATGSDYFPEIAKLRAARLLWAKIIQAYDPSDLSVSKMHIHSVITSWNQTVYDPHVNILRAATSAMSAIIGGTGSLTVPPFDAAYKDPDDFSDRIARNIQLLLKEESFLDKVTDASAGSYYIENLTHKIAQEAWEEFLRIEKTGGYIAALKTGYIQDSIAKAAGMKNDNITKRKHTLLGTNQYPDLSEKALGRVSRGQRKKSLTGKGQIVVPIKPCRGAEKFEDIRLRTERAKRKTPKVFLFTYGNLAIRSARAMFSTNFFGCAGFQVIDNNGFETVEQGIKECRKTKPDIVVICSTDEEYPSFVMEIYEKLKKESIIVIAGYPGEWADELKKAGIRYFIHKGSDMLSTLKELQKQLGIT